MIGIVIIVALVSGLFKSCSNTELAGSPGQTASMASETQSVNQIWATEYTPITDFKYYVDHDQIIIEEYKGKSRKVYVAPAYEIDGIMMDVIELGGVFVLNRIDSAIISPGIRKMKNNIFNSCGVKNVYLPASLEEFDGWNYFHDGEKLYYEGTETQFNSIFDKDRKSIDFTRIIFETSLDNLLQSGVQALDSEPIPEAKGE